MLTVSAEATICNGHGQVGILPDVLPQVRKTPENKSNKITGVKTDDPNFKSETTDSTYNKAS